MSAREFRDSRRRTGPVNGGMNKRLCTIDGLRSKTERDEDIKNFAETTMNELLGWYGYDKVNSAEEARDLSLHHRTRRPSSSSASPQGTSSPGGSRGEEVSEDASEREMSGPDTGDATLLLDVDSVTRTGGNETVMCAWCLKEGFKLFTLKTAGGLTKAFCSELCFDQCRRAAFKKNRICDWCKHVRHTVNYVDFQDKDHQLQFCSDKCLNQYKMNIFCKETQAYLQMNPHLRDAKNAGCGGSNSSLITPDLWMKDCKEFANGHPNDSDDEDGSPSLEQPLPFASGTSQSTDSKIPYMDTQTDMEEEMAIEPSDKGDQISKSDNKQRSESSHILPFDSEKQNLDRRKKHRITDRTSLFKPDRRLTRMKGLINEDGDSLPQTSAGITPKKYFLPDRTLLQQTVSPPPYHQPPPLLNGPMPLRNVRSSSPSTSGPSIPPVSSTSANLPPPPPLLNSELLHHPFANPQLYQSPFNFFSHQQQLEALFAMQNGLGMRLGLPGQPRAPFPELMPPNPMTMNGLQPALMPPSTMMLPYPLVLPLPFPIPIPIPIPSSHFENAKRIIEKEKNNPQKFGASTTEQAKRVDSIITKLITKHNTGNSNHREIKDDAKNFECNENHTAASGRTAFTDSASTTCTFPKFQFHENDSHLDSRKGKQRMTNEHSKNKLKHFKAMEKI